MWRAIAVGGHSTARALEDGLWLLHGGGCRRRDGGDHLGRSRRQCVVRHGNSSCWGLGHSRHRRHRSTIRRADATCPDEALLGDR